MALKSFRPLTASLRFTTLNRPDEIAKKRPERSLVESKNKTGGRNTYGRITSRRRGGGHKKLGRSTEVRQRQRKGVGGYTHIHTAIDAHSRLAYSELLADERKDTAAGFWLRANTWFIRQGIQVRKVLTDNGSCYRSHAFRDALGSIEHRRTRPYRPQTNGKVERFHRTLADEWAYARLYTSDAQRCQAYLPWLHTYNHHRGHTALGGQPPASRVPNLSGQYN